MFTEASVRILLLAIDIENRYFSKIWERNNLMLGLAFIGVFEIIDKSDFAVLSRDFCIANLNYRFTPIFNIFVSDFFGESSNTIFRNYSSSIFNIYFI